MFLGKYRLVVILQLPEGLFDLFPYPKHLSTHSLPWRGVVAYTQLCMSHLMFSGNDGTSLACGKSHNNSWGFPFLSTFHRTATRVPESGASDQQWCSHIKATIHETGQTLGWKRCAVKGSEEQPAAQCSYPFNEHSAIERGFIWRDRMHSDAASQKML